MSEKRSLKKSDWHASTLLLFHFTHTRQLTSVKFSRISSKWNYLVEAQGLSVPMISIRAHCYGSIRTRHLETKPKFSQHLEVLEDFTQILELINASVSEVI